MIKPRVLSQETVAERLRREGFRHVGEIDVDAGSYSVWITQWGEPVMIPADGPDRVCADFILHDRITKALATKPRR